MSTNEEKCEQMKQTSYQMKKKGTNKEKSNQNEEKTDKNEKLWTISKTGTRIFKKM